MTRYFIAEVRECRARRWSDGTERLPAGQCWDEDLDQCWDYDWVRCEGCRGDGTRTVVTDIEVTPDDATSGDTVIRVWLEDPRG